jgi:hypothetical protein
VRGPIFRGSRAYILGTERDRGSSLRGFRFRSNCFLKRGASFWTVLRHEELRILSMFCPRTLERFCLISHFLTFCSPYVLPCCESQVSSWRSCRPSSGRTTSKRQRRRSRPRSPRTPERRPRRLIKPTGPGPSPARRVARCAAGRRSLRGRACAAARLYLQVQQRRGLSDSARGIAETNEWDLWEDRETAGLAVSRPALGRVGSDTVGPS